MNTATQKGFLMLADITGFTPFVANTELEHSNEILHNILEGIVSFLTPTFSLAEIEGDAVFVHAPIERLTRPERIFEIIEASYSAFRDNKASYGRLRTCTCRACQLADVLDLKFIVHYGEYILNDVGGKKKPLGTSVNTIHRLLKNSVTEVTGWSAYILFTRDCIDAIGIKPFKFRQHQERYDHIGTVETFNVDLDELYIDSIRGRRVYLSKDDADVVIERNFPVAPAILWNWMNDPKERTRWSVRSDWVIGSRPAGRIGVGATNHCTNSKFIEKILDYRPYCYYTSSIGRGFFIMILTNEFNEIPSGTRLSSRTKLHSVLPRWLSRFVCKLILEKGIKIHDSYDSLYQLTNTETLANEAVSAKP